MTFFVARRYRVEAKRYRAIWDSMRSDEAGKSMREVARYYEKLADRHERRPIALAAWARGHTGEVQLARPPTGGTLLLMRALRARAEQPLAASLIVGAEDVN